MPFFTEEICEVSCCNAWCGYPYCGPRPCKTYCSNSCKYNCYLCQVRTLGCPFVMACFSFETPFYILYYLCACMKEFCSDYGDNSPNDPDCDDINNKNCLLCLEIFCCKSKHEKTSRYYFETNCEWFITDENKHYKMPDVIKKQPSKCLSDIKFVSDFVAELDTEQVTEPETTDV